MRIFRYFLVLFIPLSFLIVGCSNDDFQEIKSDEDVSFLENKITLEDAKTIFDKQELQKLQKKRTEKNSYYLSLEPEWNEFSQGKTPFDIEFSSVPVKLFQSKVEGKVLFLRDNDTVKSYLFMLKKDKINEKGEVTDVRFYLFDIEGYFLDGYKFQQGTIKRLVLSKPKITSKALASCTLVLKEMDDAFEGWDMGCGSVGGSGKDDDPYILSEVVVSAPYKNNNSDSYHSGAYYSSTYFNNLLSSNNNYHNSYDGSYQNDFVGSGGGGSSSVSSNFNNFGVAIAIANQVGSDNDFIWELEDDERKFFDENFSIKKSFINFYKESRYSAEALNFLQETFNASKNVKFDFNEIFSIKRNNKSFNFTQAFTLLEINKIANPITGKPVEFYLLLKHKNPQYFDISSFSVGSQSIQVGSYTLTPHYSSDNRLVFYTASRYVGNRLRNDIEYIIQPNAVNDFKNNIDLYTAAANLFYLNGIPSDGQIALAAGDYIDGLTKMWGEAFTSSEWWAYAITTLGQASINPSMAITPRNSKQLLDKYFVKWQEIRKNFPTQTIKNIDNQWFKLGYVVRDNWKGYKNIFRANLDEIAEAKIKIKKHRDLQGGGDKGNYGYLEGKIGNISKKGEMVRSGEPDKIKQIFIAEKVNSQQEINGVGAWLRTTDSEYKMLNRLANELGAEKGKVYKNIIGELKIVSERAYCPSCQGVIQQFNEMFPNVKIILIDGVK